MTTNGAEPDAGDVEALAESVCPCAGDGDGQHVPGWDQRCAWTLDLCRAILASGWLIDLLAATADRARREGAAEALREAADELWGPSYAGGIQWGRTDYVGWLRARADRLDTP